ncbi:MAG: TolC family protein [Phaeodactylibacter sp.]|nr:TolC family protein [Phaeodactylibacter sp.]
MVLLNRLIWGFALVAVGAVNMSAQEQLSLSDAIQVGLENNLQLRIADQSVQISANNNNWATAGRYPTVDFSINSQNGFTDQNNPASPALPEYTSINGGGVAALDASWLLFDGYRVRFTKEQLETLEAQSQGNAAVVAENVIQSIILSYYQVQIQAEQLGVLEEVLTLSRDRVDYQEIRKEYGQASTFDILQSEDAYLSDSTSYLAQLDAYEAAMRNLNLAMGVEDLGTNYVLTDNLQFEVPAYEYAYLEEKMFSENKNLKNLLISRELARINTELQEAAKSPTVRLGTGATYNVNVNKINAVNPFTGMDFGTSVGRTFNYYFNISATYRLYDGGVRRRNVENAQMQELSSILQVDDQKRILSNQLQNTLATYNTQRNLLQIATRRIETARQNLQIADERFKGGLINSFDYRTIQLSYINASQAQLNARFNLKVTETELIRLTGGLVRE